MTTIVASAIILVLAIAIARWVAAVPLLRTLSTSIDTWADAVQGRETKPLG